MTETSLAAQVRLCQDGSNLKAMTTN